MLWTSLGYHIEECVLSSYECDALIHQLGAATKARPRAGLRHLMGRPDIAALAIDRRLLVIAQTVFGSGAVPFRATLFNKSIATNWLIGWHQDTALPLAARFDAAEWDSWSRKQGIDYCHAPAWVLSRVIALRVHLDASGRDNGPLRVVPGSHRHGVLSDEQILERAATNPHVECMVSRGGVLAMRPLLIHASSKLRVSAPRRVLHIEYADSLDLTRDIRLALA